VAFIAGYANLLFAFFSGPPDWLALSRVFILTNAALSLIITGLIYIGIYRFGYTPFAKWFLAVLLVIGIIPQILFMSFRSTMKNLDIERIIEAIAAVNPLAIIAVGLAIYAGLMQAAIYVRRRENADI
jgi:hypothetical protein